MFGKLWAALTAYGKKSKVEQKVLDSVDDTTMNLLQKNNKALGLSENVIADATKKTNSMAMPSMREKMIGNPILGNNAELLNQANPLNLFKQNYRGGGR